ncbi:MAG: hypothetical protein Q8880_12280 [Bacteroidota bacterium]|nr:hypothetical protein [Bacteroidota bacterium]
MKFLRLGCLLNLLLIFACLFFYTTAYSQEVSVKSTIDANKILIGDQIKLHLTFNGPAKTKVKFPLIPDSIKKIEVINRSKIDTVFSQDKKNITLKQTLTITSFDSGSVYVPAFEFNYKTDNDTATNKLYTDSIMLTVQTMKVDTTLNFKDIKPPLDVPLTFKEILPYILGVVGVAVLVFLGIYFYRRYKNKKPLFKFVEKPKLPADILALQQLEELRKKKLWQDNRVKEYYSELTEILRIYLDSRYEIMAMESTSDEIIQMLKDKDIPEGTKQKLNSILSIADLVKFAKMQPIPTENDMCFSNAVDFVNETKIVIINSQSNIDTVKTIG